jgi:predicted O-methyltransferase YrrM
VAGSILLEVDMEYPNWFKQIAQNNFEEFLLPEAGKPNLNYLQLGVFTGDASLWLLENVLTDESSQLLDVDTWKGADNEPIQEQMDFASVYDTYQRKVGHFPNRFHATITTQEFLLKPSKSVYDFIYVDAHHTSASAFLDCELSWPLLKSGGILAIDDYEWLHPGGNPIHAPKAGIHMFLDRHLGEYKTLVINDQVWLRKH